MTKRMTLALLGTLVVSVVFASRCPAAPQIGDLTGLPPSGPLGPAGEKAIDKYVGDCIDDLIKAKMPGEVKSALSALKEGYHANQSVEFQIEYCRAVSKHAPKALSLKNDPLRQLKEVNLSIAVANFEQYTILKTLKGMADHQNPGVRYWAAKGFGKTGHRLIIQGTQYWRGMVAALEKMGLKDPAGPVVTEAIVALGNNSGEKGLGGKAVAGALEKVWLVRCQEVVAGKEGMADVIRRSMRVIPRVAQQDRAPADRDASAQKRALQMCADALEAASRAFKVGKASADAASTKALQRLLIGAETSSAAQLAENGSPVSGVLASEKALAAKRLQVRLEVNKFWKPKFQAQGVVTRIKAPEPAATEPATTNPAG